MRGLAASFAAWCRGLGDGWNRFWFTPTDPTPLAAIRICTGLVLLYAYLSCTPQLFSLIGPEGWIDAEAIRQLKQSGQGMTGGYERFVNGWWGQSLWFHVPSPAVLAVLHGGFLLSLVCFTVGLFSRPAAVVVWVGHLSFIQRGATLYFGMDCVLAMLTLYLMFAPLGAAFSVDRLRKRSSSPDEPAPSWSANVVLRLIQVHLCLIYLCAGLSKLQGARWWDGTAVWMVMMLHEYAPVDVSGLAYWGDTACHLVSGLGVLVTLFLEIGFVFLIWNRSWRPVLLTLAAVMHVGIGVFMGMSAFGVAMLTACLAFVPASVFHRLADRFFKKVEGPALTAPVRRRRAA